MEFAAAVRTRRMCRSFAQRPVDTETLTHLFDLARRAPSAGFAQGIGFVVLRGPDRFERFWDLTLPRHRRAGFAWPGLLDAPVIVVPVADSSRYLERYSEPDKAPTGLGADPTAWPVPYWVVDCAFAVENLLLAVTDRGLGALFFGIFHQAGAVSEALDLPDGAVPIGAIALGHPAPDRPSASVRRGRRDLDEVVHDGSWGTPLSG
ncbi:MAG: nitroreductase family protein [Acidimicrobiales bacterium]